MLISSYLSTICYLFFSVTIFYLVDMIRLIHRLSTSLIALPPKIPRILLALMMPAVAVSPMVDSW